MLASIEYGSGTPVILVHGLLGSKINMAGAARSLGDRYQAIAVDLRNHGESFHHNSMNYRIMAADIGGFMDDNGFETASLVGHSMGGKCAMQFALSFPDRVDKLVVVDIAPGEYKDSSWNRYLTAMLSIDPAKVSSRSEADASLKEKIPSGIYRQFLLSNLVNDEDGTYRWRPNLSAILSAQDDIAAPVSGPSSEISTLFIRGSESKYVRDEDQQVIQELFPNSNLTTVADCGHLVHIEARDKFNQLLLDFL
ncbi:MAG: alpha/beta fold hydrolase [Desulfocapsaceae bacterium]